MESKAFYKHDSNSRNSAKILRVRARFKAAGYGVYHMLLERLRDEESHISDADYEMLAMDIQESPEMIRSVVEDFGLFELSEDGRKFWSPEFLRRLGPSDELRATRAEAGRKGAQRRWAQKNTKNAIGMAQDGKIQFAMDESGDFADSKTPSTMAKNGKIMASDSKCHNNDNPEMAKLWQNPQQDGTEWQMEGIRGREEKEINKEKEKNIFFSTKKGDMDEAEKREQILSEFFFRNYPKPAEEYRRLVAYNGSERWAEMSAAQQADAAQLWRQQPAQPGRFDKRFLDTWQRIYRRFVNKDMDIALRLAFIDDTIEWRVSGKTATLRCPKAVYDFIEGPGKASHYSDFKLIFMPFMKTIDCTQLKYDWN